MPFSIEALASADFEAWVALQKQLWPQQTLDELRHDARALLTRGKMAAVFVAKADGEVVGFAEATLRVDFVNGTSTSPVTFLEGLYVAPAWRHKGVARALCDAVERWGARNGCTEFASDALVENESGRAVHAALGFAEIESVVYFVKPIEVDAT
ncbi:MAG TPA: aminoglycoside 6'-N-acetyltransferase [Candidatus Baltobacteraceae bacterium]|jgi:aminoglycoside 6'-N-acetyltransferase I